MIEILYKDKNCVLINKPNGIASQSDTSGDDDAMKLTSQTLSEMGEESSLWLVHRLDRVVGGVLAFARNRKTASELSALVGTDGMCKEYFAVVHGALADGTLVDYLYKDSAKGKAFVVSGERRGSKKASLDYKVINTVPSERGEYSLIKVKLVTGRFHQIRAQFSSRKNPLVGDGKYGSHDNKAKMPALFATGLSFELNGKTVSARRLPDINEYPWSLFAKENYI